MDDFEWFEKQDWTQFIGKWVVVVDQKMYGSGDDLGPILKKLKSEKPGAVPFVHHIRDPDRRYAYLRREF